MKHIRTITVTKPATAQLDVILQVISVIGAIIGIFQQIFTLFGIDVSKGETS